MKRIILLIFTVVMVVPVFAFGGNETGGVSDPSQGTTVTEAYPPVGWVTDIREAYKIAQEKNLDILVNFTGSDWCVWCRKLSGEVFSTAEFRDWADKNAVLVYVDSPSGIKLDAGQELHNRQLGSLLGVQGFPTIWLFDKDLNPVLSTGYRQGGAEEYIRHLKQDRPEVGEDERRLFREGFRAGIEKTLGPLE